MQLLQCVIIIVNIIFIISHESVTYASLKKASNYDNLEYFNNGINNRVEADDSIIYKNYFVGPNEKIDGNEKVDAMESLLLHSTLKDKERKADKSSKGKKEKKDDKNMKLLIYDTNSGRLIGRSSMNIGDFLDDLSNRFGYKSNTMTEYYPYRRGVFIQV